MLLPPSTTSIFITAISPIMEIMGYFILETSVEGLFRGTLPMITESRVSTLRTLRLVEPLIW
jgi:hypothetical protein